MVHSTEKGWWIRMFRIASMMLVALLLLPYAGHAFAEGEWSGSFQRNLRQWIETISEKDPQFALWKQAQTEVKALGANQHQWLVTITHESKQAGYMVVSEVESGPDGDQEPVFALLEYGTGEFILFDQEIAPRDDTAVPVYDGFASFWQIKKENTTEYIDAKTGEAYPASFQPDSPMMASVEPQALATADKRLTKAQVLADREVSPFDQIDWVNPPQQKQDTAKADAWNELPAIASGTSAILTVSLFQNQVTAPFTVGSLHVWSKEAAYVGVWDDGLRFLPVSYASRVGTLLYENPPGVS
jgi:hypothetical protein